MKSYIGFVALSYVVLQASAFVSPPQRVVNYPNRHKDEALELLTSKKLIMDSSNEIYSANLSNITKYNVHCSVDDTNKQMQVLQVDGKPVHIEVIPPNGETNGRDGLSLLHQFPGVASEVLFPPINDKDAHLYVLLNNGVLALVKPTKVYTNFHKHQGRFIYGQLRTFVIDDFSLADQIYIGAPIFMNKTLVSVVTCRYDDYDAGTVMFPVSGVRPNGLVSGQFHYDNNVLVSTLKPNMSVYGKHQMLYQSQFMSVKRFALTASANRLAYRDLPRSVAVFHNKKEIIITLTEGEFEIDRVRFDGPIVTPQHR